MRINQWMKSAIGVTVLLVSSLASATLIVTPGVDNTGTDNVLHNACNLQTGPALTVQGCLNSDHSFLVNFTSNEDLLINGGQAKIVAQDGAFNYLNIFLDAPGWTFNKLLLNIDSDDNGFVTFTGSPGGVSSPFALAKNGDNKFILTGEDFQSISFLTTIPVNNVQLVSNVKQVRIGGIKAPGDPEDPEDPPTPSDVPVPATPLLFGLGLLGLGWSRKNRTRA